MGWNVGFAQHCLDWRVRGKPARNGRYELHRLLGALLSAELPVEEKLCILETEYEIPMEEEEKEEVRVMCNLGEGIREKAEARGKAIGEARGKTNGEARGKAIGDARGKAMGEAKVILGMYSKGYSLEQIADVSEKSIEEVRGIVEKRDTVLV